jgi:hypothetical protein
MVSRSSQGRKAVITSSAGEQAIDTHGDTQALGRPVSGCMITATDIESARPVPMRRR